MKHGTKPLLSIVVTLAIIAGTVFAVPFTSFADDPGYTRRDVTAHIYTAEATEQIECLFFDFLPDEPYVDAVDFLRFAYLNEFKTSEEDGKIVIINTIEDGTVLKMVCDPVNETVWFDDVYTFIFAGPNLEGTDLVIDYAAGVDSYASSDDFSAQFDLGKYGFDLVAVDGKIYFPLSLISCMFLPSYNSAFCLDGEIYFQHQLEDYCFDLVRVCDQTERDEASARYGYGLICLEFDCLYGAPSSAILAGSIVEKGFDRTLEEYDENTKKAKELLLSTDVAEYYAGLFYLFPYLNDGGHTLTLYEPLSGYALDAPAINAFKELVDAEGELGTHLKEVFDEYGKDFSRFNPIFQAKNDAYAEYEPVKSWEDGSIVLIREGDTAIFSFDGFYNEDLDPFLWSLEWAKENGIVNFVLDISTNGGGVVGIYQFMLTAMMTAKTHSSRYSSVDLDTVTGIEYTSVTAFDLNRDKVFDEKDDEVVYDFNFAILTSCYSFSSANSLAVNAKESGIAIIGETSGGGACIINQPFLPGGHFFTMSSNLKMTSPSRADFDLGAAVDIDLTKPDGEGGIDYSGLYDFASIDGLLKEFYRALGDVNGDFKLNAKDVVAIMKFLVGSFPANFDADYADYDGNGKLNAKDVTALMKALVARAA